MDKVIAKLSQIEAAASSVMDGTAERKKEFAAEMEKKTAEFDARLEQETRERIDMIRRDMEAELTEKLARQSEEAKAFLKGLEENYEKNHEAYVDALFQRLIEE